MKLQRIFLARICLVILLACAKSVASATDASATETTQANPHDDMWRSNAVRYADIVIQGDGGTWRRYADEVDRRNNACSTLTKKIRVDRATPDELHFTVLGREALAGCGNFSFALKLTSSGTLVGPASHTGRIHEFTRR